MTRQESTSEPVIGAQLYVRGATICAWSAIVLAVAIVLAGWWGGSAPATGRFREDWLATAPWSAALFALLAAGALLGRRHSRVAVWLFGLVLVLVTAMAALLTAGVDDFWSPFATEVEQAGLPRNGLPRGGTLVVVAMITLGALLLLARRAPGTRTALSTTAALFAAASMFATGLGLEDTDSTYAVGVWTGSLALLAVGAVGAIDESVAPAILARVRPLTTMGRVALGVTVAIPVIAYIDAAQSVVEPRILANISSLVLVAAIAGAVSWFGWADFESQSWRQIAENATDAVLEVDSDGIIRRATGHCVEVTGWRPSELVGTHVEMLIEQSSHERHRDSMRNYLRNPKPLTMGPSALPVVGPDGDTRLAIVRLVPAVGPDGPLVFATFVDATRESELQHQATHDHLTQVLNRAGITEVLERELAAGRDCGVLFVDLDNLKTINDELSHESGDRALRAVAQAIESRLRGRDRVGRIGGDEFMCVLTNLQDMAQFREVAGRVAQSIRDSRISRKGGSTGVKASIGGVIAPSHGDAQAALAAADECMYAVKNAGGDGIFILDKPAPGENRRSAGGDDSSNGPQARSASPDSSGRTRM